LDTFFPKIIGFIENSIDLVLVPTSISLPPSFKQSINLSAIFSDGPATKTAFAPP
jgi:hypothetical protein